MEGESTPNPPRTRAYKRLASARIVVLTQLLRTFMKTIGVAIIGCGGITLQNHAPGLAICPDTKIVALCDTDRACLEKASQQTGVKNTSVDYLQTVQRDDVRAVIIATPNISHGPIAQAAIAAGKHILCEKP